MPEIERYKLVITTNKCQIDEPCAICGRITEAPLPLALLVKDSCAAVCEQCGSKHEPELQELLRHFYAIGGDIAFLSNRRRETCEVL